ncbi:hypothetical protein, partial [uncultured Campylobacter sp.]|uniref:hypothetical protein n=1 Tax=uncultured Campylobacter sp. TaxID=218934 RepID=UPI00262B5836
SILSLHRKKSEIKRKYLARLNFEFYLKSANTEALRRREILKFRLKFTRYYAATAATKFYLKFQGHLNHEIYKIFLATQIL